MIDVVEEDEELPKQDLTFDQISCVILKPCGHAFPEKEVEDLYDEIMEFRSLRTERRKCEDPERLKELSFIIEAQEHVVNNRTLEISFEHVNKFDD